MNHWTREEITDWLYGLKTDTGHLDQCAACRVQAEAALERRRQVLAPADVSSDFLAAQRRAIYARIENRRPGLHARWVASIAMLIVAAVLGLNLMLRPPSSTAPLVSASDARLYSDLVTIDQSGEPRALKPIENLFEE